MSDEASARQEVDGTVRAMIGYLSGVAHGERCVMTSGGVGYVVHTTRPLTPGEVVEMFIHTQVRDDAITLYGFAAAEELDVFSALCKVQGVGPQMAVNLLRDVGWADTVAAISDGNAKALTKAAGVGSKVAERILSMATIPSELVTAARAGGDDGLGDLVDTLENLGWDRPRATEAAHHAANSIAGDDEGQLLAAALANLRGAA